MSRSLVNHGIQGKQTMWQWWAIGLGGGLLLAALLFLLFRKRISRFGAAVQFERARESFRLQQEKLHGRFFEAAATSGKPRGLVWKACDWESDIEFVRDRATLQIVAFAAVTIHFDAVKGGDMDDVEAVTLPRTASAVFYFTRGRWHTAGTVIMNKNPDEAVRHFGQQYEALQHFGMR